MKPDPSGATFIRVPLAHVCVLVLTQTEYRRGLKRGKLERRGESNEQRTRARKQVSILEALGERIKEKERCPG